MSDDGEQERAEALIGIGEYLMSIGTVLAIPHECDDEVCLKRDEQAKAIVWSRVRTMLRGAMALADNDPREAAKAMLLMAAEDQWDGTAN